MVLHQRDSIPRPLQVRPCSKWIGVFAEFEHAMIQERVRADLAKPRAWVSWPRRP